MIELTVMRSNIRDNEDIIKLQITADYHNYIVFSAINEFGLDKNNSTYFLDESICKNLKELLKNI